MTERRPPQPSAPRLWGIVPAAGFGRRMGCAKQTLPFRDSTVGATVVETLLAAGLDGVVCVTRREILEALRLPVDPRVQIAFNDKDQSEMIDSIRIGLACLDRCAGDSDGVLVAPADMPELTVEACVRCAAAHRDDPSRISIAAFEGRRGHPIIFPFELRHALAGGARSLRELRTRFPDRVRVIPCDGADVVCDMNVPGDYERICHSSASARFMTAG